MERANRAVRIGGIVLAGIGVILLVINYLTGGKYNIALPLVFMVLGPAFFILVFIFSKHWSWAGFLFIPGAIFIALGVIFLLNVITNDWNSWAYAWLLLLTGAGFGVVLAARFNRWRKEISTIALGVIVASITLFAVFGVIAGGLLIAIMAPLLLVLAGLSLRWIRLETILSDRAMRWFGQPVPQAQPAQVPLPHAPPTALLEEPLSAREIEVMRLIDRGLTNQEIATALTVAPSTIKTHINNIYGKLGVETRVQAINRARDLGILPAGKS